MTLEKPAQDAFLDVIIKICSVQRSIEPTPPTLTALLQAIARALPHAPAAGSVPFDGMFLSDMPRAYATACGMLAEVVLLGGLQNASHAVAVRSMLSKLERLVLEYASERYLKVKP